MTPSSRGSGYLPGVVVVALVVACGSGTPSLDSWESDWEKAVRIVPPASAFDADSDQSLCENTVGRLRAEAQLSPAPNSDLENAAGRWLAFAESLFFECPLGEGEYIGWEAGYTELTRLEAEVAALIAFERDLRG